MRSWNGVDAEATVVQQTLADYEAGRWPRTDLEDKVRADIALSLGLPLETVSPDSSLSDLCDC
jgi:hypothetical protein